MKITTIVINILSIIFFAYEVFSYFATGNIPGIIIFGIFLAISAGSMLHKMRKGL